MDVNRIRELRTAAKLTMKQLGALVGASESSVSLYETGKRQPDNETCIRIADIFGVSLDYLLGRPVKEKPTNEISRPQVDDLDDRLMSLVRQLSPEMKKSLIGPLEGYVTDK